MFKATVKRVVTAAIILGIVVVAWKIYQAVSDRKRKQKKIRVQQTCAGTSPDETIFVSIASYRDPECLKTVFDCFEKASCPLRIFIGVCQQNYAQDTNVNSEYERKAKASGSGNYSSNLRVYTVDASEARGPMYARALIEKQMYRGEKYYLVIDSHTVFSQDWDKRVIAMLRSCRDPKAVLTMYPDDYDSRSGVLLGNFSKHPPSYFRFKKFNGKSGLPEFEAPRMRKRPLVPHKTLFWGGCFSFASAQMIREVPFDPTLPYVFMGEELSMAARLYTHGWNLYSPTCMLVKHMWSRKRPTFWEQFSGDTEEHNQRRRQEADSYQRLRVTLRIEQPTGGGSGGVSPNPYGLGSERTLAEYERYCGVNLLTRRVEPFARVGIIERPTTDEILVKFGSLGAYHSALSGKGIVVSK